MESIEMAQDLDRRIKEGFLQKQSRFLRKWRKYQDNNKEDGVSSLHEEKVYSAPTEIIHLSLILCTKSIDNQKLYSFQLETEDRSYLFTAFSHEDKKKWMEMIGKCIIQITQGQPK